MEAVGSQEMVSVEALVGEGRLYGISGTCSSSSEGSAYHGDRPRAKVEGQGIRSHYSGKIYHDDPDSVVERGRWTVTGGRWETASGMWRVAGGDLNCSLGSGNCCRDGNISYLPRFRDDLGGHWAGPKGKRVVQRPGRPEWECEAKRQEGAGWKVGGGMKEKAWM